MSKRCEDFGALAAAGRAAFDAQPLSASRGLSLTVRPAVPSDGEPLSFFCDTVLRKDYFLRRGQLDEMLSGPHHRVWVAEIDTILVGIAITTAGTRLVNAIVHPGYRGLGIGRALVQASGATQVRAKLDMSTGDPRAFYRRLGFRATGKRNPKGNIELMQRPAARDGAPARRERRLA